MRRPTLSGPLQRLAHLLALTAGWLLFVALWWGAFDLWPSRAGLEVLALVVVSLLVVPTVTGYWVYHNLRLHRRKQPRRHVPSPPERYDRDWLGRRVTAAFGEARSASVVEVEANGAEKRFLARATGADVSPD